MLKTLPTAAALGLGLLAVTATTTHAQVTLVDGNAQYGILGNIQQGVEFSVDGTDLLDRRDLFYRTTGDTREMQVDNVNLTLDTSGTSDADLDGDDETYFARWIDPGGAFTLEYSATLLGGQSGSGTASLSEIISVTNNSGAALAFTLFLFNNYDLSTISDDDAAVINPPPFNNVLQTGGDFTVDTSFTPEATTIQVAQLGVDNVEGALADGGLDNLVPNNAVSGVDALFAVQYDFNLAATGLGSSAVLSVNTVVVPEPASAILATAGLVLLAGRRASRGRGA